MADILDFEAATRRREAQATPHPILDALDALASALADRGHEWTDRERLLYETAVGYISGGYTGSGSSA